MTKAVRVLHVVGSMDVGGVETWLMDVLRRIDRERLQMDFCCLSGEAGIYAQEIESLGGKVHTCRLTPNLLSFSRRLDRVLAMGHYDVVHSHVHLFSGYVLRRAARSGIRQRVAHSFTSPPECKGSLFRRAYAALMKGWIRRYATRGAGNSESSMSSLFGTWWQRDPRWRLLYCGVDLMPFRGLAEMAGIRALYGIPERAVVIGHVGNLVRAKNHQFAMRIAAEIKASGGEAWLLLVGDGPLRRQLEQRAKQQGLTRVVFAGRVPDIRPYLASMDVALYPSLWEGLPQSVIEAQAAGLRCLCSDTITAEVAVVPGAVRFLSLREGAERWAGSCLEMAAQPRICQRDALEKVAQSPFVIEKSVQGLLSLYYDGDH